ncbi:MAG: hypothetical protein IT550_04900 [Novosphingobium sp.]|jgi:hypothetical protein|nr:hypothetical protein [Novosphingobium sp.]
MPGRQTTAPLVPAAWGEVIDKITILEIKNARIADAAALANVRRELDALNVVAAGLDLTPELAEARDGLRAVNAALWDIEDAIRAHEQRQDFGAGFIALARAVYQRNDARAALKRRINVLSGSALVEEKSYHPPAAP